MHLAALLVLIAAPVVVAAVQVAPAPPPTVVQVQQWFEAGQYDDVTEAAPAVDDPKARYLAAASFERLGRMDQARQAYTQLSLSGARDPWAMIGRSAQALSTVSPTAAALPARAPDAEKILAAAEQSAQRAVQLATPAPSKAAADAAPAEAPPHPALAIAHYQLGLVQAHRDHVEDAAASFGRAVTADPSFAYAHYYAGLMYSRLQREDQATVYWEAFLNLAPKAPEAPQVQTLMPALRAR